MPFVTDWSTADKTVLLNFDASVLQVFSKYRQLQGGTEAGGILLGTVHEGGLLVTEASEPTTRDMRRPFLFERLEFRHRALAESRWRASGGTTRYLGEWHTHPQDHPAPSMLDRHEWKQLARKRADGRPMLAVIVGRRSLHVELVAVTSSRSSLRPIS
jgi:integrative and conjugative element protein (TIGR02256 family)